VADQNARSDSSTQAVRITRALLSVSDKRGLVSLARALASTGVELVSTGGTARALAEAGLTVVPIEQLTGFPEMMDGRVKTLHPRVHGGLLARRDLAHHMSAASEHGIVPIDLVCVNLYPFEGTIAKAGVSRDEAIENIDIGGPSMIRSAAKNYSSVTVVTDPSQYAMVEAELAQHGGATTLALRERLAAAAFARTAAYDAAIANWFAKEAGDRFPEVLTVALRRSAELRYGENPHQAAALYGDATAGAGAVVGAPLLGGKALSYNNVLDASAALDAARDIASLDPHAVAVVVVKHTNPCGAALRATAREAFLDAYSGDPLAAYGGIVAVAGGVDASCAQAMVEGQRFLEVVVAHKFSDDAVAMLSSRWKNVRLVAVGGPGAGAGISIRTVSGGALVQEVDAHRDEAQSLQLVAGSGADKEMRMSALFAMSVSKHLKSNAVCICDGTMLLGAGAGQMDRVAACRLAVEKAGDRITRAGSTIVAASDAFFPFPDGPAILIDAGVRCIVHPGGSKRDQETVDLCTSRGVTCLLTGVRHFKH